jgi:hypothetical protein
MARRVGRPVEGGVVVLDGPAAVRANQGQHLSSLPGALGEALGKAGRKTAVVGNADTAPRPKDPSGIERPAAVALMDGVSAVRRVFAIDIPLLMPQFRIVVILSGIFAVQNFVPILLLTNGGPGTATMVPGLDMYQSAFQNDQYGYGMAIGTLLFAVMLIFTLAVMRALRPRTN